VRVERLGKDKLRFFLTHDDLLDRGIKKEDIWNDVPRVNELFNEMIDHAYDELNFEVSGPIAMEIFSLPSQGLVVILTKGKSGTVYEDVDFNMYQLELTIEESSIISYIFKNFDDLIDLIEKLNVIMPHGGRIFLYKDYYILKFEKTEIIEEKNDLIISILSEYGEPTTISEAFLLEYGKLIISDDAINILYRNFIEKKERDRFV